MRTESAPIVIREINELAEMREVEALQKEVWGVEDREVFPALGMIPLKEVGAILLGAFAEKQMVGFVFGFPGFDQGRPILHSDMLAIKPAFRAHGLGHRLKLAQRERALVNGIDTITWTFDPLQAVNAHLNFGKLGVTADRYCTDYYGETTSFLHSTGTDRLWVTWRLNSGRVQERIRPGYAASPSALGEVPVILTITDKQDPIERPDVPADRKFLEIPADINQLLKDNGPLARRWREATRKVFTRTILEGFVVEDFYLVERNNYRVGRYLLTAKTELNV
jgi:predicted GNAT superfamily acetyltransferase